MQLAIKLVLIFSTYIAIGYFSAFNLVGANFLFPGRYTYGLICTIGLLTAGLAVIVNRFEKYNRPRFLLQAFLFVIAINFSAGLYSTFDLKAYFIFGFFFSGAVFILNLITVFKGYNSLIGIKIIPTLLALCLVWISLWVEYFLVDLLEAQNYQRFIRQQLYVFPILVLLSLTTIVGLKSLRSRVQLQLR